MFTLSCVLICLIELSLGVTCVSIYYAAILKFVVGSRVSDIYIH